MKIKRVIEIPEELYNAIKEEKVQNGSIASHLVLDIIKLSKPYEESIIRDCGEENE